MQPSNDSNPVRRELPIAFESYGSGCQWVWPLVAAAPYEPTDRFWITDKGRADLAAHEGSNPDRNDLVLERLPNGEHVWLRPDSDSLPYPPAARFRLTPEGRIALAEALAEDEAATS